MFTRVVEITAKTGKGKELARTVNDQILPVLRNQSGFVDEIALVSQDNPDRLLALSFWKSREDAEKYHREGFPRVNDIIRNLVEGSPEVRPFEVVTSTIQKIAAGKAA